MFNREELLRYSRHFLLPDFGRAGQEKLKQARVLVVGAGGLGSPLLLYLAAAGVGTIGIIDHDTVDLSNLHRQVLFNSEDKGKHKSEVAKLHLQKLNPHITIEEFPIRLGSANALSILKDFDVVADGTDNFPTRYLVNDACVLLNKVNVHASIFRFEGQVSVFNYTDKDGDKGPDYRDIFPVPPPAGSVPDCSEAGVLGVLPGMIGAMQANEVIKVITGIGEPLSGRLFLLNALTMETQIIKIQKEKNREAISGLIDYEYFCNTSPSGNDQDNFTKEITADEFIEWKENGIDFQLIDVREKSEYDLSNMGGQHIPLRDIEKNIEKISRDKKVVIHCRSGKRSAEAIKILETKYGFTNLYNLYGGIIAYESIA